jgi:hypothetical protein
VRRTLALLLLASVLAGCGTTHLITNEPTARIYVDGELVGRGTGEVRMRGLPGSANVLVLAEDGRRRQASIKRSFSLATFLFGFITYGVCWIACWDYPGAVSVDFPERARPAYTPTMSGPAAGDPWLQPPPGWRPPDAPPATP